MDALVERMTLIIEGFPAFVADDRVSSDLKKAIVQGRCAKKLTQAQLAQVG